MYKTGCKILMTTGILLIVLGIYAVLFNNTPLFTIINWIMDPNFWVNEKISNGTLNFKIFTWDFLGMFHIIWGVNIIFIVRYGLLKKKEAWAWISIFIQVVVWLVVVIYFTLSLNRNTFFPVTIFFAVLFMIPLIMTNEALKIRKMDRKNEE